MAQVIYLFFVLYLVSPSLTRTVSKCELVHELRRQGIPENLMKDFVCLVEAESSFQTHVQNHANADGSTDWGLFQINDRYWCNAGDWPGKGCNVRCNDLLSDNIFASVSCAKTVLNQHGIHAWVGWNNNCRGKQLPEVHC